MKTENLCKEMEAVDTLEAIVARTNFVFEGTQYHENDVVDLTKDRASGLIRRGLVSVVSLKNFEGPSPEEFCKDVNYLMGSLANSNDYEHQADGDFIKAAVEPVEFKNPRTIKEVEIDIQDNALIEKADEISKTRKPRTKKASKEAKGS